MDWLVRPLAITFCGGAVGGSSGRETLNQKIKSGWAFDILPGGQHRHVTGREEARFCAALFLAVCPLSLFPQKVSCLPCKTG